MEDYLRAVHGFATDGEFRWEFRLNPTAALRRRGLCLRDEQIAALTDIAREDDHQTANSQGRIARWFQYGDLTPSALGGR